MPAWSAVAAEAPELAQRVRARFEATGLRFLATLRGDGAPRVSGIEPLFTDDELWLGMMDRSRKGADRRRDPRLCLHNASADKDVTELTFPFLRPSLDHLVIEWWREGQPVQQVKRY